MVATAAPAAASKAGPRPRQIPSGSLFSPKSCRPLGPSSDAENSLRVGRGNWMQSRPGNVLQAGVYREKLYVLALGAAVSAKLNATRV